MASGSTSQEIPCTPEEDKVVSSIEKLYADFCDEEARTAATDLLNSWDKLKDGNSLLANVDVKDVCAKFLELFPKHIETVPLIQELKLSKQSPSIHENIAGASLTVTTPEDILEVTSDEGPESPSPHVAPRPFFRKLSFKGLRKRKGLFLKQHSDEVELSPHRDKIPGKNLSLLVKITCHCGNNNEAKVLYIVDYHTM